MAPLCSISILRSIDGTKGLSRLVTIFPLRLRKKTVSWVVGDTSGDDPDPSGPFQLRESPLKTDAWNFIMWQVKKESDGRITNCLIVNERQACSVLHGTDKEFWSALSPTITAIEVQTDLILSPIDIEAKFFNREEISNKYMDDLKTISSVQGARSSPDKLEEIAKPSYPLPFFIIAPPIILQTRRVKVNCTSACKHGDPACNSWGTILHENMESVIDQSRCKSASRKCPWLGRAQILQPLEACQRRTLRANSNWRVGSQ